MPQALKSAGIHRQLLSKSEGLPGKVSTLLQANGPLDLVPARGTVCLFEYLCQTIVAQQLSSKAAATIWKRVEAKLSENRIDLAEYAQGQSWFSLRDCGISKNKAKAIHQLSIHYAGGAVDEVRLAELSTDDLIK